MHAAPRGAKVALMAVTLGLCCGPAGTVESSSPPKSGGDALGRFEPGPRDAITDVDGVRVGHVTLHRGDDVHTGVTAIVPHGGNVFTDKVPAAIVVANGFGKLVGYTQVHELGQLETPILLTNTLQVFDAAAALVTHTLSHPQNADVRSVNPVVGETNDGWLSEIRSRPLQPEHFSQALRDAKPGPVEQGSVGAGTGTRALGFKGGIGTASRVVGPWTVGVLVQTNFGGSLVIDGVAVGEALAKTRSQGTEGRADHDGSCMIVVATDAPLNARQLGRLARRTFVGMARTGASFSHGSGDYAIAFSTAASVRISHGDTRSTVAVQRVPDDRLSELFEAVADATEVGIVNSLVHATTVHGRDGHTARALPLDRVRPLLGDRALPLR